MAPIATVQISQRISRRSAATFVFMAPLYEGT